MGYIQYNVGAANKLYQISIYKKSRQERLFFKVSYLRLRLLANCFALGNRRKCAGCGCRRKALR